MTALREVPFFGGIQDGGRLEVEEPFPGEYDIPGHGYERTDEEGHVITRGRVMYHYHLIKDARVQVVPGLEKYFRGTHYYYLSDWLEEEIVEGGEPDGTQEARDG